MYIAANCPCTPGTVPDLSALSLIPEDPMFVPETPMFVPDLA